MARMMLSLFGTSFGTWIYFSFTQVLMTDRQKLLMVENAGIRSGTNFFAKRSFISFCRRAGVCDGQDVLRLYACDIHEIASPRYDDSRFSASRHSQEQRCSIYPPDSGFLLFVEAANIEFLTKAW